MSARMYIEQTVIPTTMMLLPQKMESAPARRMLVAIGMQESRFEHRRQINGPARGFWQFERGGGVKGVIEHPSSQILILDLLRKMGYDARVDGAYVAIEHNDILACAFARLLLWTDPKPLPTNAVDGWHYYLRNWRPGRPHESTWEDFYEGAS